MSFKKAFEELADALSALYDAGEARSLARIVMEDAFQFFFHQADRPMSAVQQNQLRAIQRRLLEGEPVQYVLGRSDFYGYTFKVSPAVLIPRQETEELVLWMIETLKNEDLKGKSLLDIGTGSGCIAIVMKKKKPDLEVWALDISREALAVAQENTRLNQAAVHFLQADILQPDVQLPLFDVIVSNPPYIPFREKILMTKNVLDYEPEGALFVRNEDPLLFYRTIADFSLEHLKASGWLFFETNAFNADQVVELLKEKGFDAVQKQRDIHGKDRMIRARSGRAE